MLNSIIVVVVVVRDPNGPTLHVSLKWWTQLERARERESQQVVEMLAQRLRKNVVVLHTHTSHVSIFSLDTTEQLAVVDEEEEEAEE